MSGLGPANSRIKTDAELEEAIHNASGIAEIADLMHEAAIRQKLVRPDMDPNILNEVPEEAAPHSATKDITVNGVTYTLEAATTDELAATELQFFRDLQAAQSPTHQTEQPRNEHGQHTTADEAATHAAAEAEAEAFRSQWSSAVEAFRAAHPEWDELAGEENTRVMSEILESQNLVDATDKASAMAEAFRYGIKNELFQETVQGRTVRLINEAQTPEQLRAALGRSPYAER